MEKQNLFAGVGRKLSEQEKKDTAARLAKERLRAKVHQGLR